MMNLGGRRSGIGASRRATATSGHKVHNPTMTEFRRAPRTVTDTSPIDKVGPGLEGAVVDGGSSIRSGTATTRSPAARRSAGRRTPRSPAARRRGRRAIVLLDAGAVSISIAVGVAVLGAMGKGTEAPEHSVGFLALLSVPIYLISFSAYGLYRRDRRRLSSTSFPDLFHLAHALAAAAVATLVGSHLLHHVWSAVPRLSITGVTLLTVPCLLTVPLVRVAGVALVRVRGIVRSKVIILGSGTVADSVARRLASFDDVELLGCVDDPGAYGDGGRGLTSIGLLGSIADLPDLCTDLDADRVIVAFSPARAPQVAQTLRQLPQNVLISVVPRLFDLLTWRSHVDELHGLPVMDVAPPVLSLFSRFVKRAMDLAIALGIAIVGLPAWIATAVAIKATSPGPVFFKQLRSGRGGRPFGIYKFRTMRVGAEEEKSELEEANEVDGPIFKIKQDPRVTRVGRILRATSLDEFPQLINVIKGDMSLVGPRPFVLDEADRIHGWAARRFDVRPGMTGLWQISGRNDLPFEELRSLDYAYVASWSIWWDLKILWHTPSCVLRRRGAY